ncbi:SIMPL domain-containing protein [Flavisolibacter tropicus]|uniref:DUF541 domain-containing protein n=1 Tax=Flavisolibacter tropicus TaxID=1492898 RepID=A0A172TXD1_9BACT|nr:SIMPL domain-containing protein [Flavisolibacter tropicus]ANE51628.1 hypothetical protein SY85_15070 [Flavisolibacter tropicus]
MKKRGLLFSAFLFCGALAQAQDQYVEVTVKDTLMVEPKEWYYYIKVEESYEDMDVTTAIDTAAYAAPTPKNKAKPVPQPKAPPKPKVLTREEKLEQVKALALAHGGELLPYTSLMNYIAGADKYMLNNYSRYSINDDYALNLRFNSRDSLHSFLTAIGNRSDVEGGVVKISHPDIASFYEKLDVKLIDAGKQKAARLAQLAGRKLGPITQIVEASDATKNPYEELFQKLTMLLGSKSDPLKLGSEVFPSDKIKIEKTLKFRFAFQ